jgi:hypothetical protein
MVVKNHGDALTQFQSHHALLRKSIHALGTMPMEPLFVPAGLVRLARPRGHRTADCSSSTCRHDAIWTVAKPTSATRTRPVSAGA